MTSAAAPSTHCRHLIAANGSGTRHAIEFGGFLTNHLSHGLLALDALGASPALLDAFANSYIKRVNLVTACEPRPSDGVGSRTLPMRGSRQGFGRFCRYYAKELKLATEAETRSGEDAVSAVVVAELPTLVDGLAASAFHAIIELGLGVLMKMRQMVTCGRAYLSHSFVVVGGCGADLDDDTSGSAVAHECRARIQHPISEILALMRKDGVLTAALAAGWSEEVERLPTGYFQKCMHIFANDTAASMLLRRYASLVRLPEQDIVSRGAALVTAAATVYASAPGSDYFLLHGLTAALSVQPLIHLLLTSRGRNREAARRLCERLLLGLLATYVAQHCLPLSSELDAEHDVSWPDVLGTVKEQQSKITGRTEFLNEHQYKVVWLCKDFCQAKTTQGLVDTKLLMACARKAASTELSGRTGERPLVAGARL